MNRLAVVLIHEQISLFGAFGIALVIFGIYLSHLTSFSIQSFLEPFLALRGGGSLWALCTGGTIAAYSLVDKVGVGFVHPPVYIYLMLAITWLLLSPYVLAKKRMWLKKRAFKECLVILPEKQDLTSHHIIRVARNIIKLLGFQV